MRHPLAAISFAILLPAAALCQSPVPKPAFEIADVRLSPRENWVQSVANKMRPGILSNGRYEIHRATMLDLIRTAYSVDADQVFGGPSWLEYDRFDIIAKTPRTTRQADLRLMLQTLLADRFHLVVRPDSKPIPAWLLSVAGGGPKLKSADASGAPDCQTLAPTAILGPLGIRCRNVALNRFVATLRGHSGNYFHNLPLIDATGLEGSWDIDLQYSTSTANIPESLAKQLGLQRSNADIAESLNKQLGLTVELKTAPQPVVSVESVIRQPTANPAGVASALPPLPSPEFEVASIKPCEPTFSVMPLRFLPGGRVTGPCEFLVILVKQMWNLGPLQDLPGAPKWLTGGDSPRFRIDAKAPAGAYLDPTGAEDTDALKAMMRALLIDRFKMKIHYEDRPVDSPTLVAVKPKLTKADPAGRTGCTRQPLPDGSLQLVCRNITMAQFAEQIPPFDPFTVFFPVLDATGIEGAWDFTLTSWAPPFIPPIIAVARGAEPGQASEPSGRPVFGDALTRQLGLKLEMRKRPQRVLVIDHIEQKPTEN